MARGAQSDSGQGATRLCLTEYVTTALPRVALPRTTGEWLWQRYGRQIRVEFPTPQTGDQWLLTPQGWVGLVPLPGDITLEVAPRVPLRNLFGMLEYAWRLRSLHVLAGVVQGASLAEWYEQIAYLLAQRILALTQRGLYQRYEPQAERRAALRGRIDLAAEVRAPWQPGIACRFDDLRVDCLENRALLWTLHVIVRGRLCGTRVAATLRRAYHALQRFVTLVPIAPETLDGLTYHRLNAAYHPLHALCRFFLRHTGPGLGAGTTELLPFLVQMPRLFELFVAEWLAAHLPASVTLRTQEPIPLPTSALTFVADGVIRDRGTGKAWCVFDTKYLAAPEPNTDDVAQVVAYAHALGAPHAVLIYPAPLAQPLATRIGAIQVQSATFALADDLAAAGAALLTQLDAVYASSSAARNA